MPNVELQFLKSAIATDSTVFPTSRVLPWIEQRRTAIQSNVAQISLEQLRSWHRDPITGVIRHETGGFFTIEGIRVRTNWGRVSQWEQPIINQPEIGILGFLAREFDGVLHLLVQAKIEPGNINTVQLSPTLQATKSNYSRLHQGRRPRYLEYFNGEKRVSLLIDQLQSEQGARFLRKRNRNIIVELPPDEPIDVSPDHVWLTIGQIKELMRHDNLVNMDTRTVLSGISFGSHQGALPDRAVSKTDERHRRMLESALTPTRSLHDFREIISWITRLKSYYDLTVERVPLKGLDQWIEVDGEIRRPDGKYFSVIGVTASIGNREVVSWDQPMIKAAQEGLIAFIVRPIAGTYHFLVQAKLEAGNFDVIEMAPTVQCLTGNYRIGANEYSVPYINDVLSAPLDRVLYSSMQSEEGGRFYREQNRNVIIEVGETFPLEVGENYCWMTLQQILRFVEFNNYLNIAARSLISAIAFA